MSVSASIEQLERREMLSEVAGSYLLGAAGLLGSYYDDTDLQQLVSTRIDAEVSFSEADWPDAPSGTGVTPDDRYSERWAGYVRIDQPGDWTFYTLSDDGVRLWVDNTPVIDNWGLHTVTEDTATLQLQAGWHPIRLEHYQQDGSVAIQLSFAGPGQAKAVIPSSHLSSELSASTNYTEESFSRFAEDPFEKYDYEAFTQMVDAIRADGHEISVGHPRIFIRPDNIDQLRQKIADQYADWMQQLVDYADSKFGLELGLGQEWRDAPEAQEVILIEGLIYQLGSIPGIEYDHSPLEYGQDAVRHLTSDPMLTGTYVYHNYYTGLPLGYDWLYELMTPSQRQLVADVLLDYARTDNAQILPYNNPPGARLLGALAVYGDSHVDPQVVEDRLSTFYNGVVVGEPNEDGVQFGDGFFNLAFLHIFAPEGPGAEGLIYSGAYHPVYPFLLAWRDQTGEDYFELPFFQNWVYHMTHLTGNEYEHADRWSHFRNYTWAYGYRDINAFLSVGLAPSNPEAAALSEYHLLRRQPEDMNVRILYMLASDPTVVPRSPEQLGMETTAHFEGVNNVLARESWEGTDSIWVRFQGPTYNLRDCGPLNNLQIWKNGGMLLGKHFATHDYDEGNRTNTLLLYDENQPGKTFIPENVQDFATTYGKRGELLQDVSKDNSGYHQGLRYFEEQPGEYLYAFGDGDQTFFESNVSRGALAVYGSSFNTLPLPGWSRQFIWFRAEDGLTDHMMVFDRINTGSDSVSAHLRFNFNMNPEVRSQQTNASLGDGQMQTQGIWKYEDGSNNRIVATNTVQTDWGKAHSRLFIDTLLPADPVYYRMGGLEERYIDLFGNLRDERFTASGTEDDPQNILDGMWRVQMTSSERSDQTIYLNVLQATDSSVEVPDETTLIEGDGIVGAAVADNIAFFNPFEETLTAGQAVIPQGLQGPYRLLFVDLQPHAVYDVAIGDTTLQIAASERGAIFFDDLRLDAGQTLNIRRLASVTVEPTSGLETTEAGGTASFTVVLDGQPAADVTIGVSSGDPSEGTVSTSSLTFTASNWDQPQTVTVTGVDDALPDGSVTYTIVTAPAVSDDPNYNGFNPADVSVSNQDDEPPTPDIAIRGNNVEILDGDTTPRLADHTDFGSASVSGQTVTRTFTIRNTGTGALALTGTPRVAISGPNAGNFAVVVQPASSVAAGGQTTFQITFDPSGLGLRSATVTIISSDPDESPYEFAIQGTGTGSPSDTTPPTIVSAEATGAAVVEVVFSEPVERASAEEAGNYGIDQGVSVLSAVLNADLMTVTLATTPIPVGVLHRLTVSNVRDRATPPNAIAPGGGVTLVRPGRVTDGLVALYELEERLGNTVHDTSGVGAPLDLIIGDLGSVSWIAGGLSVDSSTIIASAGAATKITEAVMASGEVTVEAWVAAASAGQAGPARIASLSSNTSYRNFTLGQQSGSYDFRLRSSTTSTNGIPSISTGAVIRADELTHVVYTRDSSGQAKIYVDGIEAGSGLVGGGVSNWDRSYRFALANEFTMNRSWLGEIHLVAVYEKALTLGEVQRNFELGADPEAGVRAAGPSVRTGVVSARTDAWTRVTMDQTYESMVVVVTPSYERSEVPLVARVRNAVGAGFEVRLDRADGGTGSVGPIDVHYLVVEEGVYSEADHGVKMEAIKITSTVTDEDASWVGQKVGYQQAYSVPVVVGQVMSYNDPDWSVFWARGPSKSDPPTASALYVGKHVGEDGDASRANETIGYVVIEAGCGTLEGVFYAAGVGGDTILGMGDKPPYTYEIGLPDAEVAVASQVGMDGGNGGWAVLYGETPVTDASLRLAIDEDRKMDSERNHTTEQVAYIVFGRRPEAASATSPSSLSPGAADLALLFWANDNPSDGDETDILAAKAAEELALLLMLTE